jgi:hypothetical protein
VAGLDEDGIGHLLVAAGGEGELGTNLGLGTRDRDVVDQAPLDVEQVANERLALLLVKVVLKHCDPPQRACVTVNILPRRWRN